MALAERQPGDLPVLTPFALGRFGQPRRPHPLEVRQRPRREVVAAGGHDVHRVEGGQVVVPALDDLDAGYGGRERL